MRGVQPCGCGQCLPCRINKSREWSHRIMLESRAHEFSTFVTLTYKDEELNHISDNWNGDVPLIPTIVKKDYQLWLKRLRKYWSGSLRYFLVAEYGDKTQRPHYHAALFGFPNCVYGKTRFVSSGECCLPCSIIKKTWDKGHSYLGELNKNSAQYIAGYVTKKWTKEDLWTKEKLKGRLPELARMSLKPGIGATAIKKLINFTEPTRSWDAVRESIDAPVVLRSNGSTLPLGRYLRRKWREALGRSPDTPKSVGDAYIKELQGMYQNAKALASIQGIPRCFIDPKFFYEKENRQKILNIDKRSKIRLKRSII